MRKNRIQLASAMLVALAIGRIGPAGAALLFGTDIDADQLLTIDTTTGAATAVGALGFGNVYGLSCLRESTLIASAEGR